jgi:hypothetical protein
MSFDIYMMFFRGGEPARIPRTVIARVFGAVADTSDPRGWWDLADSSAVLNVGEEGEIEFLSVNRPPHAEHPFWPALVDFLRETGGVLFWPGGGQVVTDQVAAAHLPPKMIEILGPPIITNSAEEILKAIADS